MNIFSFLCKSKFLFLAVLHILIVGSVRANSEPLLQEGFTHSFDMQDPVSIPECVGFSNDGGLYEIAQTEDYDIFRFLNRSIAVDGKDFFLTVLVEKNTNFCRFSTYSIGLISYVVYPIFQMPLSEMFSGRIVSDFPPLIFLTPDGQVMVGELETGFELHYGVEQYYWR